MRYGPEELHDFVKTHEAALLARLPREFGASLPHIAGGFCDEPHRVDVQGFFQDKAARYQGGPRTLAQVLEGISLCAAQRSAQGADVAAFLKRP